MMMTNLNDWTALALMGGTGMAAFGGLLLGSRMLKRQSALRARSLRELERSAYADLDPVLAPRESPRALARRVCTTVAKFSPFQQVAMFMPDAESCLHVAGSTGVDDLESLSVGGKVARFARERRRRVPAPEREFNLPAVLDIREESKAEADDQRQILVLPMWSHDGEMMGALAIWRRLSRWENDQTTSTAMLKDLLGPLLELAAKLGRSLDLNRMSDRLLGSERLAMVSRAGRLSAA